jgi:hypothetical protein
MPMGIHRHVVRTVAYDDRLYHLKELPRRYADREWRFLRYLARRGPGRRRGRGRQPA